ncbi:MAG: hypothetical protein ACLR7D_06680 [Lachnospira eligens]
MMERLRMSIFNGDIFKNNGSPDKAPEPKEQEDDSDNPADKDDKKDHRKRLEDIIDMSGTSLVENRTIISSMIITHYRRCMMKAWRLLS